MPKPNGTAQRLRYLCGMKVLELQSAEQRICPECGNWIILHRWLKRSAA
jgi:hypothetical protein